MTYRLDYYGAEDLARIVRRSARILGVEIEDEAAEEISRRARGTPRVANRILRRVRDVAQVRHDGAVTLAIAQEALALLEVDGEGLERIDRELLRAILEKFDGGPVGLSTLAVSLGEETDTIEDVYEPYLLQLGLIQRTPRGRVVTEAGPGARRRCRRRPSRASSRPEPDDHRRYWSSCQEGPARARAGRGLLAGPGSRTPSFARPRPPRGGSPSRGGRARRRGRSTF